MRWQHRNSELPASESTSRWQPNLVAVPRHGAVILRWDAFRDGCHREFVLLLDGCLWHSHRGVALAVLNAARTSVGARDGKKPAVAPPKSHSLVGRSSRESVVPSSLTS